MVRREILVGLVLASMCLISVASLAGETVDETLTRAAALYDPHNGAFDFVAYEGRLREAIRLYEEALPLLADDSARLPVLHQLARAYFELANAYLFKPAEQEAAYKAGKDYALVALRVDPAFVEREKRSFRDALSNASNLEAVFWYGTNFGCYINYHQFEAIMWGWMYDVPACYERAIALDETYLAGAPLRSLGCYLAQVPGALGGSVERARELLTRAMGIAPEFLQNAVDLSEWVLKKERETDALCSLLAEVKADAQDAAIMGAWPYYNELALRRAERLSSDCP